MVEDLHNPFKSQLRLVQSQLKQAGLWRELKTYHFQEKGVLSSQGHSNLIDFASNDYLGLSQNIPLRKQALKQAQTYALGGGASNLVSGYQGIHQSLSQELLDFFLPQGAQHNKQLILTSSTMVANIGTLSSLATLCKTTTFFHDKLNHASLLDGSLLKLPQTQTKLKRFNHRNYHHLSQKLQDDTSECKVIVSDSLFSMDGDYADTEMIKNIAQKTPHCLTYIDDAHGAFSPFQVKNLEGIDFYVISFAKSLGLNGGCVIADREWIEYLHQKMRAWIYSTAISPFQAFALSSHLKHLQKHQNALFKRLNENIAYFKNQLKVCGIETSLPISPIVSIQVGTQDVVKIGDILAEKGFLVGAIRYPTVPLHSQRIRVTIKATHLKPQLKKLAQALSLFSSTALI